MAHDPSVSTSSAQTAKDRLLNLKKTPSWEAMINGFDCTKEQYEEWITSPLEKQIQLEMKWGFLWRESYPPIKIAEPEVASSVEATLAQRGSRYGDFTDHAELCQHFKYVATGMTIPDNGGMLAWDKLSAVQKQALEVIFDKIARILTGDPNYDDNWHDIQGYAKLVEDRLPCNQKKEI